MRTLQFWLGGAGLMLADGLCWSQGASAPRAVAPVFPGAPPPPYVSPDTAQGSGPYPAIMEVDPGLPTHTAYRPKDLAGLGTARMPIVVFGNGACIYVGNRFRFFLTEIASHGFLALAIGPIGAKEAEFASSGSAARGLPAPGSPAAVLAAAGQWDVNAPIGGPTPSYSTAAQLTQAIDWALAENARAGSRYHDRLDTARVAVMGQSCGGIQAIAAASDARVSTLGVWNSGLFNDDARAWEIAAAPVKKADLAKLRIPTIYITGEPSDVAFKNTDDDVDRINGAPVFRAWREQTGHGGTYREPGGGAFGKVAVAWLQWRLKDDPAAARMFTGPDCGLCTQADWHVRKKRID